MFKIKTAISLTCLAFALTTACSNTVHLAPTSAGNYVYLTEDDVQRYQTPLLQILPALEKADIVILGETHDNAVHHRLQAELIHILQPGGVAFEMVPEAKENVLNANKTAGSDKVEQVLDWGNSSWPAWEIYAPVFEASASTYLAGGGLPSSATANARENGAASAFTESSIYGLDIPLPTALQTELVEELIASHCNAIPESVAVQMAESQRLRDASFAKAVLRAREKSSDQVVLITGSGHARNDRGVPLYLRKAAPTLNIVSLSFFEAPYAADTHYDFTLVTQAAQREDPCAGFAMPDAPAQ